MAISAALHCARIACLLALVAPAGGLVAQTRMYKSIGPDGQVTFTDKPPAAQDATPYRPGGAAPAPARTPTPAPTAAATPSVAVAPLLVLDAEALARPAAGSPNPAAERSARSLILLGHQVTHTMQRCGMDLPKGRNKYGQAMDAWTARHRQLVQRAYDVANELLGREGQLLSQGAMLKAIDEGMSGYRSASPAARLRWCDAQWQQIESGRLDKLADASVTGPLGTPPAKSR
ncbi:MAG: hypothetical protein ACO1PB_14415 [Ramlibacter sp.]